MNKKTISLILVNLFLLSLILYLNGYRLFKSSFYQTDLLSFETDSYEVIYDTKKMSIVKFDQLYKFYTFDGQILKKLKGNFESPFMFDYLYDTKYHAIYDNYPYNIFTVDQNIQYDYRYVDDDSYLVQTKHDDLVYKYFNLLDSTIQNVEYNKIELDKNLYLYTFDTTETPENIVLEAFVDDERIISDLSIFEETYYNIHFDDKTFDEQNFMNPLESLAFKLKDFEHFNLEDAQILLSYTTKNVDAFDDSTLDYKTTFLKYKGNIYWTYDDPENPLSLYLVNRDDFNQAYEKFKRVLD